MSILNINWSQTTVLQAVTTHNGASLEHDADQRFYLMFGIQAPTKGDVKFQKVCSFVLLDPNSIEIESHRNQCHLSKQDLEVLKYAIQMVSYRLLEMLCSEDGMQLWGEEIPTPTELVESYFIKKSFIFSAMSENSGIVSFDEIKDWTKQLKPFYIKVHAEE